MTDFDLNTTKKGRPRGIWPTRFSSIFPLTKSLGTTLKRAILLLTLITLVQGAQPLYSLQKDHIEQLGRPKEPLQLSKYSSGVKTFPDLEKEQQKVVNSYSEYIFFWLRDSEHHPEEYREWFWEEQSRIKKEVKTWVSVNTNKLRNLSKMLSLDEEIKDLQNQREELINQGEEIKNHYKMQGEELEVAEKEESFETLSQLPYLGIFLFLNFGVISGWRAALGLLNRTKRWYFCRHK